MRFARASDLSLLLFDKKAASSYAGWPSGLGGRVLYRMVTLHLPLRIPR